MIKNRNALQEETAQVARNYPQVAGGTRFITRGLLKTLRRESDDVFDAHRNKTPTASTGLSPDQLKQIQNDFIAQVGDEPPDPVANKRTPERNINIQRHHQGALKNLPDPTVTLENMKTADDISILLDVTAEHLKQTGVRSHEEVAAKSKEAKDVIQQLKPVFEGTQNGLLNDRQLYAARTMLSTQGEQLVDLARRINGGDQTPEILLQYKQKMEQWTALQGYVQNQVQEVARALSQQNMIAKSLNGQSAEDMMSAMHIAGTSKETIVKQAEILLREVNKAGNDIEGVSKAMRPRYQTAMGAAVEFWKNNILSGPSTHAINIMSNTATNMYETLLVRPTAAAVGTVRRGITGANDGVTGTEAFVNVVSTMNGVRTGMKAFIKALKSGEGQFGADKGEFQSNIYDLSRNLGASDTMSESIQKWTTLSFRALQAEDELFKTTAFMQELSALAARDGKSKGLSGDELHAHMDAILSDPPDDIYEGAITHAKNLTFTNEDVGGFLGDMANNMKRMSANHPWFGFLVPFINTPTNLVKYSINNSVFSVIAPDVWKAYQKGGADKDIAIARVITSYGLALSVWEAYESENITGAGPQDYGLAEVRDKSGERPEALVIGEGKDTKYIEFGRLDPLAQSALMIVNAFEAMKYAKDEKTAGDAMSYIVAEMAKHTFDSTYMRGMGDIVAVMNGRKDPSEIPANLITGFIPYVGMLKSARKYTDPQRRRFMQGLADAGFLQRAGHKGKESVPDFMLDMFGLNRSGAYARYWDGTPKTPRMGEAIYAMSPVKVSGVPGEGDAVNTQLFRNRVAPNPPTDILTIGGVRISMVDIDGTGEIYDKYAIAVGKKRRELLTKMISKQGYRDMDYGPKSERAVQLKNMLRTADAAAKAEFMNKKLPGLIAEAAKNEDNVQAIELKKGLDNYARRAANGGLPELEDFYQMKKEGGDPDPDPPHF